MCQMDYKSFTSFNDNGPNPCVISVGQETLQNQNFRTTIWTGRYMQMTVMCIPGPGEIGPEVHPETDQYIRIEQGEAIVEMGCSRNRMNFCRRMCEGDAVLIPAGTWHNMCNKENGPLKISVLYAPPNHPVGTVHVTREDAEY